MNASETAIAPLVAATPLRDLGFVRLGASRVGRFLCDLLTGQGARWVAARAPTAEVGVVIDDRAGNDAAHDDEAVFGAAGSSAMPGAAPKLAYGPSGLTQPTGWRTSVC